MRRTGLRSEILLTLAILLGSALLLGGFLFLRYAEQSLLQQRLQQISFGVRLLADVVAEKNQQQIQIQPDLLFHLNEDLGAQNWWLYDRDLKLLISFSEGPGRAVSTGKLRQLLLDRNEIVEVTWPGLLPVLSSDQTSLALIAVPVQAAKKVDGVLVARFSLADILLELLNAQRWLLLYAFAFGSVLVSAGLYLLNRNVVQPTRTLLKATRNVAAGDLNLNLESNGPREIFELAESFNNMVETLQRSRAETETHIISLRDANKILQQTQNELIRSEKLATVGYLAAGMAHEIGNPLGALTGYLALLQKDLQNTPHAEVISNSVGEAERIDRLVRELLDYSTPGSSYLEAVDPWSVVMDSVQLLELQGAFKEHELVVPSELVLPKIRIDRHKLSQVIVNLLLNSRDACQAGGRISVSGTATTGHVEISVSDNGCGIPTDQIETVFEPFYTTKAPGKGRGLGLAICQRIIAEAHGEILCHSSVGQGCKMTLTFFRTNHSHG
jgi:two-component system, NtrC family, sensor kinase